MNTVILTGNLARDPESTVSGTGMKITRFTIAVRRSYSKKAEGGQDADFIRVTCFDKTAENVEKYMKKGSKVGVEARVQTGSYQGKDGNTVYTTEFIANRVEFLDSRRDSESGGGGFGGQFEEPRNPAFNSEPKQSGDVHDPPSGFEELSDDDMPF